MPVRQTETPRSHIFTVGLTGGIGSGKTTVAQGFAAHGIRIIDADEISHALTAPGGSAMPAIVTTFGTTMQQANGALDRVAMRRLVFSDPGARQRLEAILHPMIRSECVAQLERADSPYAMLVVPLLLESEAWRARCDRILVVDCPPELQVKRVMARSALTATEAHQIIAAQISRAQRLAAATEVIDNTGSLSALHTRIDALHQHYLLESAKPFSKS
ncbi:MAG: dephospho-CoA kinase [Proteobacteria bacterium]|nr:dephospho-CoA kinase [Pseudomonadota bacterium]